MKKTFLFIGLIVLFINNSFSQNASFEVIYKKGEKKENDLSTNPPKIYYEYDYILKVIGQESIFYFDKSLAVEEGNRRIITKGGGRGNIYKNLKTKEKLHQNKNRGELLIISQPMKSWEWEITNEKKVISGYTAFKAIGTKMAAVFDSKKPQEGLKREKVKMIVWFTPEIPGSFGPAGYDELPGLVLESQSGDIYFIATKIKFYKKTPKFKINKPTKGRKVSREEFDKESEQFFTELLKKM
ncbi:GLPGLI family protein [Aureivirga sp. CE67]|uniref:GLPGLI family protein n=1 Tax=Aureivirga sp. CE67 TaxID=1788983 RepID=UPI0018CBDCD1|nr:GLPGLI family protein [Aureivirga sp. CE67]